MEGYESGAVTHADERRTLGHERGVASVLRGRVQSSCGLVEKNDLWHGTPQEQACNADSLLFAERETRGPIDVRGVEPLRRAGEERLQADYFQHGFQLLIRGQRYFCLGGQR